MGERIKQKIEKLRKEIRRHNKLYYEKSAPEFSDAEYDGLYQELAGLEERYPEYQNEKSPTREVGAPARKEFKKVKHKKPMLSLEAVREKKDVARFHSNCCEALRTDSILYLAESKLDGLSVELVYEKGALTVASTRGNGEAGEDVTPNLKTVKNIPHKLRGKKIPRLLAVRGEALMTLRNFNELNKALAASGQEGFANPRNAASGSLRQLDSKITASRKLDVFCYDIMEISEDPPDSQEELLKLLESFGFKANPEKKRCRGPEDIFGFYETLEKKRDGLDYEIDGIVIKLNEIGARERLGERSRNPRWALAYKFKPRKKNTRIEDIIIGVGRTGVLTPVALMKPVEVGGVTVSRATLHNMEEVRKKDIRINDQVEVKRAGDVIPEVERILKEKRTGREKEFHMPSRCPSCGTEVIREGVYYKCPSGLSCPAQLKERIAHFASKEAANIEGFSGRSIELLLERKVIRDVADIYRLKKEDLIGLEGWKEKKAENLLRSISASKEMPLDRFIYALGIEHIGEHIAKVLAKHAGSLEKLFACSEAELRSVPEIGAETASSIVSFLKTDANKKIIQKLRDRGIKLSNPVAAGKLKGKKVVFTGALDSMPRSEAKRKVEAEGGEVLSSVSHDVDFVVIGKDPGSKFKVAKGKGLSILKESEFLNRVK